MFRATHPSPFTFHLSGDVVGGGEKDVHRGTGSKMGVPIPARTTIPPGQKPQTRFTLIPLGGAPFKRYRQPTEYAGDRETRFLERLLISPDTRSVDYDCGAL